MALIKRETVLVVLPLLLLVVVPLLLLLAGQI